MPPFLVELANAANSQLFVQRAGTTRITTRIPAPGRDSEWDAIAAAGETTFIASASTGSGNTFTSAFYRITLSADGKLGQLTELVSGISGMVPVLAASQGGSRIAYMTILGNDTGRQAMIKVITGTATRSWTAPGMDAPGVTGLLGITSFAADGSELGWITGTPTDATTSAIYTGTAWLLPVDSAPGSAIARSREITTGLPGTVPWQTVLSADGRKMYLLSFSAPNAERSGPEADTVSAYSTVDGSLVRTVHSWKGTPANLRIWPSMTAGGSQLLVWGVSGVSGSAAYQVDPATGTAWPVWIYILHNKNMASFRTSIAW
jgi:hypothetical protein